MTGRDRHHAGYWWSHWETGSPLSNFARCNVCGEDMVFWSPKAGQIGLPSTVRKKIDAHPCNPFP